MGVTDGFSLQNYRHLPLLPRPDKISAPSHLVPGVEPAMEKLTSVVAGICRVQTCYLGYRICADLCFLAPTGRLAGLATACYASSWALPPAKEEKNSSVKHWVGADLEAGRTLLHVWLQTAPASSGRASSRLTAHH